MLLFEVTGMSMLVVRVFGDKQRIITRLRLLLCAIVVIFGQSMGISDFGYRVENIEVKLSQKFAPAMAYELLEDFSESESEASVHKEIIPLMVGLPELGPIELDEITFGVLESKSTSKLAQGHFVRSALTGESHQQNDDDFFTPQEKQRLNLAKVKTGLEISDIMPRHEVSFSDRAKAIIEDELKTQSKEGRSLPLKENIGITSIAGQLEFARDGSLALTDRHVLDVRRFEEGVPKEIAQVDLSQGTFSINVRNTKGMIIARLTNQRGGIEGEGVVAVSELLASKDKKLILKKRGSRQNVRASSAYAKPGGEADAIVAVAGVTAPEDKTDQVLSVNSLDSTSELFVEAKAPKHWPTVAFVNLMESTELTMLPDRMLAGLTEILMEQGISLHPERGDSLIWGQVKMNGRPLEGATVTLPEGQTSYFGSLFLPDQTRAKTSENGMFAIVLDKPGWSELFIQMQNGQGIYQNIYAFPGKVTQVTTEIPVGQAPISIRTFDAFNGEPVPAKVHLHQTDLDTDTGEAGGTVLNLPNGRALAFASANPEAPYLPIRLSYTQLFDYIHIPLVTKEWLDHLKGPLQWTESLQTGIVLGFIQGDDFTVENLNKGTKSKVVYFDQQGRAVPQGRAGGGFVIFNLEIDQPNLIIRSDRTEKQISRIIQPDSSSVFVVNAAFE